MEAYFNLKSQFERVYCDVPSGYLQGQTHAGISYIPAGFDGYTHWLVVSPYANYNVNWENPCVYYANNRPDGKPPVVFTAHPLNPLVIRRYGSPGEFRGFNSDPDIYFDGTHMRVLNRIFMIPTTVNGATLTGDSIECMEVTSASKTQERFILTNHEVPSYKRLNGILSPTLLKHNGKYRIYTLSTSGGSVNCTCRGLAISESTTVDSRGFITQDIGSIHGRTMEAWHMQVFKHNNEFYAIVCATDWSAETNNKPLKQYLAYGGSDGFKFIIYEKPLVSYESYRGAAYVREDGLFVLYTTVVSTEWSGEYSVDGREVLLCTANFNEMLNVIRNAVPKQDTD